MVGVEITFDPNKRGWTFAQRGLDFADAAEVFASKTLNRDDDRADYGERRIVTFGLLRGRVIVLVWTPRGDAYHIISMRKANDREQANYRAKTEQRPE